MPPASDVFESQARATRATARRPDELLPPTAPRGAWARLASRLARNRATRSVGKNGVSRRAGDHESAPGPIGYRPFNSGMDAGKRSYLAAEAVLDDGQAKGCKPAHVSIGIETRSET